MKAKYYQKGCFIGLVLLFLLAPFYIHPNIGGLGLAMPFNIAIWLLATGWMTLVLWYTVRQRVIRYHTAFVYSLLFPAILIVSGLLSDVPQADVWLFRQLYILGGFAFLFALLQMRFNTRQIEGLLYILVLAVTLHALVGVAQIADLKALAGIIPLSEHALPIGIFQQVNVLASFLTTGFVITLYLISRPSFSTCPGWLKAGLIATSSLTVFVVISTGSRVGLFSLIIATVIMLLARRKYLARHKRFVIVLLIASMLSGFAGQSGFLRAMEKTEHMTKGEYASARQTMYAIALDLIREKPVLGYGIGSFPRVWVEHKAEFLAQHPNAAVTTATTSHPHNEILFWFIEGGLIAVVGLLVILVVVCRALFQCGCSRGGAYMAMLLPITLHTQVELPFYISSLHWFVWLFLIYLVFRHQLKTITMTISPLARITLQIFILLLGLSGIAMLFHTEKAQREIFAYMYGEGGDIQFALHDMYSSRFAEKLIMQNLLYHSIESQNTAKMPLFIQWAEKAIKQNPELGMFIMLSDAYGFVGDTSNQCRVAKQGFAAYPLNKRLQETVIQCR